MNPYLPALLIGIIAGSRTLTAPAAVSWAAQLGRLPVHDTGLSFLAATVTPYIFTALAILELVADQLPKTPSRKMLLPFSGRLLSGGLCGAAIGIGGGALAGGLVAGVVGAVIGTLGGYAFGARLAKAFGRDMPAAFIEDAIAIVGAIIIVGVIA